MRFRSELPQPPSGDSEATLRKIHDVYRTPAGSNRRRGCLSLYTVDSFYMKPPKRTGVVLGYAPLQERKIRQGISLSGCGIRIVLLLSGEICEFRARRENGTKFSEVNGPWRNAWHAICSPLLASQKS
jgi:hypothetical protein